ncbi:MAG: hypothetical protein K5790_01490 [Nitrosopumilus sp.]|uniref:hypothetical protein n=1 Tax=Nitrosopumilus sp. TaxID=2024843 RepID=UPI00247B588B|nr:hypothetical protein [Nitrosopumilus sp.]MCV0391947.1 hypothetical protein [Nitrosopumilus sp.]
MKTKLNLAIVSVIVIIVICIIGSSSINQIQAKPVSYADSIFETCYDDDECTIDKLYELSKNNSTETVFLTLDELIDLYVESDFYCHPSAHHVGEFLFGYVNRDLQKAAELSDHRCAAGIMHGLLENTIQIENMLDGKSIESVGIKESCEIVSSALGDEAKKECIHGMGHSLVKIYNYNTTKALERCNEFDDWSEIYMCNGGLFMQNMAEYAKKKGGDFKKSDIYYPCNQINGTENKEAATLCHRYQANYFLIQTDYNLQETYSLCSGIEDTRYIAICYKGVAAHLTKDSFDAVDKALLMCNSTPLKYQEQCVIGAIESLTRFVSDQKAEEFCNGLDNSLKKSCQSRMKSLVDSRF